MTDNNSIRGLSALVICLIGSNLAYASGEGLEIDKSARYRTQQVNDVVRGDATAHTLKLRLSAQWQINESFSSLLQLDHVHAFNENDFSYVTVTRDTSPILDIPGTELNQAWIAYNDDRDWSLKLGRQTLSFDNDRHISSIEFWQNDQVYDAISFEYGDPGQWNLSYSYINKVHRIFGREARRILPPEDIRFDTHPIRPFQELGIHEHNSHLLNASYQVNQYLAVSAYYYALDNLSASAFSSDTAGLRLTGEFKPSAVRYSYAAEYAYQETADDSVWDYEGSYTFLELGAQYRSHELKLSYERLAENNGFAFATSLGDNHKFLGWADIFSAYLNADGLRDTYLSYRGRKAKLRWRVIAHQIVSDTSGRVAGNEFDFELAYRFNRDWEASLIGSQFISKAGLEGLPESFEDLSTWTFSLKYNL